MINKNELATITSIFQQRINENIKALTSERENLSIFTKAVDMVNQCITNGGKILLCGNGGNGASASHIVNDFIGQMYIDRQPMSAISLVDNISVLTALSNDRGYDTIFSRQVEALGQSGDLLIMLSTSGNSKNIILAAEAAKEKKLATIAMTNRDGGKLAKMADLCLYADSMDAVCSEHIHLILLHTLCECVEATNFNNSKS